MALLGIQQLNELDVLIKNTGRFIVHNRMHVLHSIINYSDLLEFETLQQTKAITEEKQKIEGEE